MGISGVFMDSTWSHDLGFYWSWSEAQKGAKDKGQIKALVGRRVAHDSAVTEKEK